jgi:hypothetical protein
MLRIIFFFFFFLLTSGISRATQILVPMDESQNNHLKAYGIAFWTLENEVVIEWLLNYRGGSFLMPHLRSIEEELIIRGVKYEILADGQVNSIRSQISNPEGRSRCYLLF